MKSDFTQLLGDLRATKPVFSGLLLREATARFFAHRFAWFWVVFEPLFHISYLMVLFGTIRVRNIEGMETLVWIAIGIFAFLTFRNTWRRSQEAINASRALLVYRQIKTERLVIARSLLELPLSFLVFTSVVLIIFFMDQLSSPDLPLSFLMAFALLWLLASGIGLVVSILQELIPEIGQFVKLLSLPLYLLSGVIFPISSVPMPYQEWLLYNPIAHGIEWMRASFSLTYYPIPGLDVDYLIQWILISLFIGLLLHRILRDRIGVSK